MIKLGELTERIMSHISNTKNLKQVKRELEKIESNIINEIILNALGTVIEHIEVSDNPTPLEIYIWLLKQKEELLIKE